MSEAVFHRLDRDAVVRRLRRHATQRLAAHPEVREVVLIGSLARGDWSARSDADLVIIVDRSEEPARSRGSAYAPSGVGVAVDIRVFTVAEAAEWSPRFRRAVDDGLLLFRRTGRQGEP